MITPQKFLKFLLCLSVFETGICRIQNHYNLSVSNKKHFNEQSEDWDNLPEESDITPGINVKTDSISKVGFTWLITSKEERMQLFCYY